MQKFAGDDKKHMLLLRSIFFNIIFFSVMTIVFIVGYPLRFAHEKSRIVFAFWKYLSRILGFVTAKIGGIKYVIENEHNILGEPAIYAIRHESVWETLMLICRFREPIFVLKKELLDVPLFGVLSRKVGSVAVDRGNGGSKNLINALGKVRDSVAEGHPVIIFPEGTRMAHGKYVPLKKGIALFYQKTDCPVVPVVHNAGYFWPRRGFIKKPGVITVKFLDPIPPGLSKDEFMDRLNETFHSEIEKLKG
ncbi:MAG: 1-acyl-sn-glycerol-3-phosphate acyltransferase [Holosporaceae bacterium]|jgi:1-acyl-sn-glycerol-3-phosphate acyltransferase|nr:1-acyl-sn-glycerol-3-phosphate acyltransferase [Holosporaceae bacterium]